MESKALARGTVAALLAGEAAGIGCHKDENKGVGEFFLPLTFLAFMTHNTRGDLRCKRRSLHWR
jgi:hypothetical protein